MHGAEAGESNVFPDRDIAKEGHSVVFGSVCVLVDNILRQQGQV